MEDAVSAMFEPYFSRKLSINFIYRTYNKSKTKSQKICRQNEYVPVFVSMSAFLIYFKHLHDWNKVKPWRY